MSGQCQCHIIIYNTYVEVCYCVVSSPSKGLLNMGIQRYLKDHYRCSCLWPDARSAQHSHTITLQKSTACRVLLFK